MASDCAPAGHPARTPNSNTKAGPRNDFNILELFLNTVMQAKKTVQSDHSYPLDETV
jgi:hypothetical protein